MSYKRGEIYYVNKSDKQKPVGSEIHAGRPAVIVSNDKNNAHSSCFSVVYLTTQPKKDLKSHCVIRSIKKISTALCEQITTVDSERFGEYVGKCTDEEMKAIELALSICLDISFKGEETKSRDSSSAENEEEIIKVKAERDTYKQMYEQLLGKLGVNL